MNRPALSLCGLFAALLSGALSGCRTKPPVVRHFLSIPAEYAGGLSSVERAKWLKKSRKQLPPRKELTATGHLLLPAFASELGTRLNSMEVMHAPGTSNRQGGLAIKAGHASPPAFLRYEPGHYFNASPALTTAAASWRFDPSRRAVTGTTATGRPLVECRWNGTAWQAHTIR